MLRSTDIAVVASGLSLLLGPALESSATTWHVPTPECPSIQAGIEIAAAGDTVLVARGTYYEHDITMKSGVCLAGETGSADGAIIDAQKLGRVIYCEGVDSTTRITGFTITGGRVGSAGGGGVFCRAGSPALVSLLLSDNEAFSYIGQSKGGGMVCRDGSSPTLKDVVFSGNLSQAGGGMYCADSSPHLTDVTFEGNSVWGLFNPPIPGTGGGMYCCDASPTLVRVAFESNAVSGYMAEGGGMYCGGCSASLTDVAFSDNSSSWCGGALHYWEYVGESSTLSGVTFSGNSARYGGAISCRGPASPDITDATFSGDSAMSGGALWLSSEASPSLTRAVFVGNGGGAIDCEWSSPTLTECTFAASNRPVEGGVINCYASSPTLSKCTLYGNSGGIWCWGDSRPTLEKTIIAFSLLGEAVYCFEGGGCSLTCCDVYGNAGGDWTGCIADQYGSEGNICADPLFCLWRNPDEPYTLRRDSPCAATGNAACGLIGAWDVGCGGPVPVERASWGTIKARFR